MHTGNTETSINLPFTVIGKHSKRIVVYNSSYSFSTT